VADLAVWPAVKVIEVVRTGVPVAGLLPAVQTLKPNVTDSEFCRTSGTCLLTVRLTLAEAVIAVDACAEAEKLFEPVRVAVSDSVPLVTEGPVT
jgi:hypothetical protein